MSLFSLYFFDILGDLENFGIEYVRYGLTLDAITRKACPGLDTGIVTVGTESMFAFDSFE